MTRTASIKRRDFRVLVCGGGVAGLEAMLALRELAGELVVFE
jgi:succinate dehydrogenase/fumarate reductase flavoprotein subunit